VPTLSCREPVALGHDACGIWRDLGGQTSPAVGPSESDPLRDPTKARPTKRRSPAPTQAPANIHPRTANTALPRARTSMVKVSTDRRVWMSSVGSAIARHYERWAARMRGSTALVNGAEQILKSQPGQTAR
jgi:hypothetical protein